MFQEYIKNYNKILTKVENMEKFLKLIKLFKKNKKKKILIFGNGGSSSIASHIATDFTKECKIKTLNFNDHNLITCFANDYGFENWIKKTIENFCDYKHDLVILISSSGNSKNMVNAANFCKKCKIKLVTLTGFEKNNPVSKKGKVNIWVNSKSYNYVEVSHLQILAFIVDHLKID